MEKFATTQDMEETKKKVHDMMELVQKKDKELKDHIDEILKDILSKHPGITPQRQIQFPIENVDLKSDEARELYQRELVDALPKEVQQMNDDILLVSAICKKHPTQLRMWSRFKTALGDYKKALDTSTSGGLSEWVPTGFSSQLFEKVMLEARVAALFPRISIPRSPFTMPVELGELVTYKGSEQTADTGQTNYGLADSGVTLSGNFTITAVLHNARILFSKESEEESVVALLPLLRTRLAKAFARGLEDAIMNGDTAGTHEDSDITAATSRKKLWLGLRAHANDQSYKTDMSTFNLTNLRVMRKNMGVYGVAPSNCAWITTVNSMYNFLNLAEVVTLDKYGAKATVLNGEIGSVDGIPVVPSDLGRTNLNASGVYDGTTTTKTVMHLAYRDGFLISDRRKYNITLLTEKYAESGQLALVVDERVSFDAIYPIASNRTTELGYNIAS